MQLEHTAVGWVTADFTEIMYKIAPGFVQAVFFFVFLCDEMQIAQTKINNMVQRCLFSCFYGAKYGNIYGEYSISWWKNLSPKNSK